MLGGSIKKWLTAQSHLRYTSDGRADMLQVKHRYYSIAHTLGFPSQSQMSTEMSKCLKVQLKWFLVSFLLMF